MSTEIETIDNPIVAPPPALRTIVFVEHQLTDYLGARHEFAKLHLRNPIHRASTVAAAMDYLNSTTRGRTSDPDALPCVIFMELQLPQCNGLDGQARLRASLRFRDIPIVAIGAAERVNTLKHAVTLGARAYLAKPFCAEDLSRVAAELRLPLHFGTSEQQVAYRRPTASRVVERQPAPEIPLLTIGVKAMAKRLGLF